MRWILLLLLAVGLWAVAGLRAAGIFQPRPPAPRDLAAEVLAGTALDADPAARDGGGGALFDEVAADLGLRFQHDNDAHGRYLLPEEMGPGAGLFDYDGDGDLDVFVTGGGAIREGQAQQCRLFRNDGGAFTDVTDAAGAGVPGPAYGVACADYDDDGDVDLFVTRLRSNVMLRNEGDGTFTDVSAAAGVDDELWGTSAAFFDYDLDGRLDLYVTNYVLWSASRESQCYSPQGVRDYCNPVTLPPSPDRLYHNVGSGRFEDVTDEAGIAGELGNGLGVLVSDFDGDGLPDVYVANDRTPAFLWRNRGDGTFANVAVAAGCAYDRSGVAIAGMGVAAEDMDDDGDFDLLVTNIRDQNHLLLANDGGQFTDVSLAAGLPRFSRPATGFGVVLFDRDHDGRLEAYVANGAVNRSARREHALNPYAEPDHFLRWRDGKFIDATVAAGLGHVETGRGVAVGDIDGDGDQDVLVTANGGPLRLYRNELRGGGSWLSVDPRTGPGARAAIGAQVTVVAGGRRQVREVRPQQSYLSSSDPRVHFGLGDAQRADEVIVRWPGGGETVLESVAVDQVLPVEKNRP